MRLKAAYCILFFQLLSSYQQAVATQSRIDSLFIAATNSTSFEQKVQTVGIIQGYINKNPRTKLQLDSLWKIIDNLNRDAIAKSDTPNLAAVWLLKANYFHDNLELDSSISYSLRAESFYASVKDTINLSQCYFALWSSHRRLNHFNTALGYFFKSKEINEQLKDTTAILSSYFNLGMMYLNKGREPLKVIEALRKPLQYGGVVETLSYCYIAEAFLLLHQPDSAKYYLKLGQSISQSKMVYQPPYYYRALAKYYKYTGQLDSAIVNFHKAIDWLEKARQNHNQSRCYYYLGEIAFTKNEFFQAENYYRKAEAISKKFLYAELPDIYLALNKLYETMNQIGDAYNALKQYQLAEDSLKITETTDILLANDLQHEFTLQENKMKKEQLIKEFERQVLVKQQRQTKIIASVIILFLSIITFLTYRSRKIIFKEKKRSDELLLNILPSEVAEELKEKGNADAKQFNEVTVMFTDFKDFTQISEKLTPSELVTEIHICFKAFDDIITKNNIEKIKTIGDSYMCAGGLPVTNATNAIDVVSAAMEIQTFMQQHSAQRINEGKEVFEIRIGVHTGPVVAGIVGVKKFAYDIWGDTVNIASRMESSGEAGKVNISGSTYELIREKFKCTHRGKIQAKNKGEIDMYFVENKM